MNTVGSTITVLMPETIHDFAAEPEGSSSSVGEDTLVGTARYVDCELLERRKVVSGGQLALEYHATGITARVFILSTSADEIEPGAIGIASMTSEGYWELVSVMC